MILNTTTTRTREEIEAELLHAEQESDMEAVAVFSFELAVHYEQLGELERAENYYERFDGIAGGDDDLYEKYHDEEEYVSAHMVELQEKEPSVVNLLQKEIRQKGEEMTLKQKLLWAILGLARESRYVRKFAELDDLSMFQDYSSIVQKCEEILYLDEYEEDWFDEVEEFSEVLIIDMDDIDIDKMEYAIKMEGLPDMTFSEWDGTNLSNRSAISGIMDAVLELAALEEDEEPEEDEFLLESLIRGIPTAYFYRVYEGKLQDVPQIQQEIELIWKDREFVMQEPEQYEYEERLTQYFMME